MRCWVVVGGAVRGAAGRTRGEMSCERWPMTSALTAHCSSLLRGKSVCVHYIMVLHHRIIYVGNTYDLWNQTHM